MRHFCKATSNNDHDAPAGAFRWYTSSINNLNTKSCGLYPFEATFLKRNSVSNLFMENLVYSNLTKGGIFKKVNFLTDFAHI